MVDDRSSRQVVQPKTPTESNPVDRASETSLLACAAALGAADAGPLSAGETALLSNLPPVSKSALDRVRADINHGTDPLGEMFSRLRSPADRRPLGATYTPHRIVQAMVQWAMDGDEPRRVIDAGLGSGRFLIEAGRTFPGAELVGVEIDPVAALIARANLAVAGFASRTTVLVQDYRSLSLPRISGKTLFIGNPPYVRHHLIPAEWKAWLATSARQLGQTASALAGMHVYFFVTTALQARTGDVGCFVTAAEWLDVNYGRLVRQLFLGPLGGSNLIGIDPRARPFADAASTAVIAAFRVGSRPKTIRVRSVDDLAALMPAQEGTPVRRERLLTEQRWTHLLRTPRELPDGHVELGELCRVHRGQVTGANRVWIASEHSQSLPGKVLFRSVTKARELFVSSGVLADCDRLKLVIDLPPDLDELPREFRAPIDRFLKWARSQGADRTYIARHRRAWWSVGLREPPPILATYMARRPPVFVFNQTAARYINIAHGIYPREPLGESMLRLLARYLAGAATSARGRTYAGGLMKFEPREMERIPVPGVELLASGAWA